MYCLSKNAPVLSFSVMVASEDDLRRAYRIACESLLPGLVCLIQEDTNELVFVNKGESPENVDKYLLTLLKTVLFIPCETRIVYKKE